MYTHSHFTETDIHEVTGLIKNYPFAVVSGIGTDGFPVATQLPLEIICKGDKTYLRGHLMKDTDHHRAFEKNNQVMAIFTGPHCYISASWYEKKKVASTWNYVTVQAKGIIQFLDELETIQILEEITNKYEGLDSPASFRQLEKTYVTEMAKYVVGFEIEIVALENVFKLSQNHSTKTRINIINELEKDGQENANAIAGLMKLQM